MRYGVLLDFIQWSTPMGWRWRWGARWRRARVYACGNQRKLQSAVAVVRTTAAHGYYHAHWVTWWPTSLPQRRCRQPDLRVIVGAKPMVARCWAGVVHGGIEWKAVARAEGPGVLHVRQPLAVRGHGNRHAAAVQGWLFCGRWKRQWQHQCIDERNVLAGLVDMNTYH